ncbi:peptidoglycan D,D-transpeptidase FtsI family protein [Lachnoclostridium sp. Marseille-P6806]|uniref:peptidoglycan D,D-transpeptidase FtsI family protein n=1 Tax=Lachnoclostridium sp. Marseille-P6806 TaxID=2364793 RepID=UPI0010316359|nr:penicillin-binding protein 2 [Lachnoclostridium sp. Marseille-P6806]
MSEKRGRDRKYKNEEPLSWKPYQRFSARMRRKLFVLFSLVVMLFLALIANIVRINRDDGDRYTRQVLLQQAYDSTTLPFRRGAITDARGTVLASSTLVYNVIVDARAMAEDESYLEPSLTALNTAFGLDTAPIREYVRSHPDSQYYIAAKEVSHEAKKQFDQLVADGRAEDGTSKIQGVWFEEAYIRSYPNNALASDVIGFAGSDNSGHYGLEEYYNTTLNGTPGRSYGYIDETSDVERTTIPAADGDNLVLTLDANIQSIVEKYLQKFNDEHKNSVHEGNGAENVGCIVMNVNSGGVLAMASYPGFNLNDPYATELLTGMTKLDFDNSDQPLHGEYLTAEEVEALTDEEKGKYLSALWKNYCISDYYEPGSVAKPFTTAAGLESGAFPPTQTYLCEGGLVVADGEKPIKCHNTFGDGVLTVGEAIERSCNVALMQEAFAMGKEVFCRFQNIFGFGLKTNIDLANEARTDTMIYQADKMGITDLATNAFGQNFDVTMIQVITGFCSLINGGNYYQPHIVSKITSASGATVKNIEPRVIKKTVSEETSEWIRSYCRQVVEGENGTGKTARPAGYMIGGKTGTAETLPRDNMQYVVSFMGYAPADDPQIAIYVVVDRANASPSDDAKYATGIVRGCLTEILPYLNIPMTEPLSDEEKAELEELEKSGTIALGASAMQELNAAAAAKAAEEADVEGGDPEAVLGDEAQPGEENADPEAAAGAAAAAESKEPVWRSFPLDEASGYLVNPDTGHYVDPTTGHEFSTGPAAAENPETAQNTTVTETPAAVENPQPAAPEGETPKAAPQQ